MHWLRAKPNLSGMINRNSRMEGKVAVVTGGSRGIGRATALALADAGPRVIIHYGRSASEANALREQIEASGGQADTVSADLALPDGAARVAEQVRNIADGKLDIALNRFDLAYLHIIEPRVKGGQTLHADHPPVAAAGLRKIFKGPIIAAGGFDREGAIKIVEEGDADLVAFGRQFISNPDLPERLRSGIPLNPYNRATFYSAGPQGYIDYPSHDSRTK
jgi:NADH:flavin oxidoreductase / NADH oxidase family/short chain dehydrogenase